MKQVFAVLAAAAVLFTAYGWATVFGQPEYAPLPVYPQQNDPNPGGITTCFSEPAGYVRAVYVFSQPWWIIAGLAAHELDHERVARELGGCRVFNEWVKHQENRLALEVSAYCVQAKATVRYSQHHTDVAAAIDTLSPLLASKRYNFGITREQARELVRLACKIDE